MTSDERVAEGEQDEPLPPPIPGPEFKRLNRRQSIIAWTLGWIVGLSLAGGLIATLFLR